MIFVFYISLFLYIFTLATANCVIDLDFWARLIVGRTFFQTGSLMPYDFESFGPTRPWFDHEWGSSLVFYGILDKFGDIGIIAFKAVTLFIVYFIITRIIILRRKEKCSFLTDIKTAPFSILFFLFLIQSSESVAFATVRCQYFTFFFFVSWLYILEKVRLEGNYRLLWMLPATMIIWSNMHGGCFTGFGLLALYIAGEFLNKKPVKPYIIALICSLAVLFINPYGPKYVYFLFHAITLKRPNITEWQPLFNELNRFSFIKFKLWSFFFAIFSACFLFKKFKRTTGANFKERLLNLYLDLDKTKVLTLTVMFLLSYKTLRIMPFFTFCSGALLYNDFYKVFNKKLPNILNNLKEIFLCACILITFTYNVTKAPVRPMLLGYPYVEAEFLRINNLKGNVLANFHYGSFLAYKLYPNNFIFMDGRYEETYVPDMINVLGEFYVGKDWKKPLEIMHIDYIIVEHPQYNIYERLLKEEDWYCPIKSSNFALFVNKNIKLENVKIPTSDLEYYQKHKWETNVDWR